MLTVEIWIIYINMERTCDGKLDLGRMVRPSSILNYADVAANVQPRRSKERNCADGRK